MARGRVSLEGLYGYTYTLSKTVIVPNTLPRVKPHSKVCGNEQLSKAGRTMRNLRPSSYNTLTYQHDQSFPPTPQALWS